MEEIIEWINKHKITSFIILLSFIVIPASFCQIIYKFSASSVWLHGEFTAGELLGYLGNAMSFMGTIILGFIAIKQNNELKDLTRHQNETNDKMMELANKANEISLQMIDFEKQKNTPFVSFAKEESQITFVSNEKWTCLFFENKTDNDIVKYEISFEDIDVINRLIQEEKIDLEKWCVPTRCENKTRDLTRFECNEYMNIDFKDNESVLLYIKINIFGIDGYKREQHFQILILNNTISYGRQILI